mgnify:CR=1 FL=1
MENENKSSLHSFIEFFKTFIIVLAVVSVVWFLISSIYDESKRIIKENDYYSLITYLASIIGGVIVYNLTI